MGPLPRPATPVPLDVASRRRAPRRRLHPPQTRLPHRRPEQTRPRLALLLSRRERAERGCRHKRPAILCLHQTTPNGKDSPVGLADRPTLHYALELAKRGYVTLSPDYPSFGEYQATTSTPTTT